VPLSAFISSAFVIDHCWGDR